MKKNCTNCEHLEYGFGDVGDSEGFVCNRKEFYGKAEDDMLEKMDSQSYRQKSKVCFTERDLSNYKE